MILPMIKYIYLKLEKNIGFSFISPGIFIPNPSKLQETKFISWRWMDQRSEVVTTCTCGVMVVTPMIMYNYLKLGKYWFFFHIFMNIYSKPIKITGELVPIMEMDGSKVWSGNSIYLWSYGGNTYGNVHLPKTRKKILVFLS